MNSQSDKFFKNKYNWIFFVFSFLLTFIIMIFQHPWFPLVGAENLSFGVWYIISYIILLCILLIVYGITSHLIDNAYTSEQERRAYSWEKLRNIIAFILIGGIVGFVTELPTRPLTRYLFRVQINSKLTKKNYDYVISKALFGLNGKVKYEAQEALSSILADSVYTHPSFCSNNLSKKISLNLLKLNRLNAKSAQVLSFIVNNTLTSDSAFSSTILSNLLNRISINNADGKEVYDAILYNIAILHPTLVSYENRNNSINLIEQSIRVELDTNFLYFPMKYIEPVEIYWDKNMSVVDNNYILMEICKVNYFFSAPSSIPAHTGNSELNLSIISQSMPTYHSTVKGFIPDTMSVLFDNANDFAVSLFIDSEFKDTISRYEMFILYDISEGEHSFHMYDLEHNNLLMRNKAIINFKECKVPLFNINGANSYQLKSITYR